MKHFRDLVLSTKEPAVKNVLWIKPIKDDPTKYDLFMYEDGWKKLFAGSGSSATGITYRVDTSIRLPDGPNGEKNVVVQLIDNTSDPYVTTNLYPKTKASVVFMTNGVSVEEMINSINRTLSNMASQIKKAQFVTLTQLNNDLNKRGNTYWVYSEYDDGTYTGEGSIRKYSTTSSDYTTETLAKGDILINIKDVSAKLGYVESKAMVGGSQQSTVKMVATESWVNTQLTILSRSLVSDVTVDGESVVTSSIARIEKDVKKVYMVTTDILSQEYPEGSARANKTFYVRNSDSHVDQVQLYRYNANGTDATRSYIQLYVGDLLFNIDDHTIDNDDFIPYTLYQYDKPQDDRKVHPIGTQSLVETWIGDDIQTAVNEAKPVFIDFVASNETQGSTYKTWDITTTTPITEMEAQVALNKAVYARITGINNQGYNDIPEFLSVGYCANGFAIFAAANINHIYALRGRGESDDPSETQWRLSELTVQPKLTFDNTPTQDSSNPVKSGGVYTALNDKADKSSLGNYVLLNSTNSNQSTSYNDRMEATPKMHRVEWIINEQDSDGHIEWTQLKEDERRTPEQRFIALWWAVFNNYNTSNLGDNYRPKIILLNGSPACYCDADAKTNFSDLDRATSIELRFFDGRVVTTFIITKDTTTDPQHVTLNVTTTEDIVVLHVQPITPIN